MTDNSNPNGMILIYKESGITSFDVVKKIKKLYNTGKVGHTGTLDPLAEGLLCILVGQSVKASEMLLNHDKTYYAGIRFGIRTDTEDITGAVKETSSYIPSNEETEKVIMSFKGKYYQTPPMYSAKKVNGKKLYEYARQGIDIEREKCELEISDIEIDKERSVFPDWYFKVTCSKGTYIRTLCDDIGLKLGTFGTMTSLKRLRCGNFKLDDAYKLEDLENLSFEERIMRLTPSEKLFDYPEIRLSGFYTKLCLNGCEIYQKKINTSYPLGTDVKIYSDTNKFLGTGKVLSYENGEAVKLVTRL